MSNDNSGALLNTILMLIMGLITFLVRLHSKSLTERLDALEVTLEEFARVLEKHTPSNDDAQNTHQEGPTINERG